MNEPASSPTAGWRRADELACSAALVLSVAGALAFVLVFLARGGLEDSGRAVALVCLMSLLPIWLSAALVRLFGRSALGRAGWFFLGFALALLLPPLGLIVGRVVAPVAAIAFLASLAVLRGELWQAVRRHPLATLLIGLALALPLIVFTAPTRLFLPETLALGLAQADNYFDLSIAQMLKHYGAISTGADGLALHSYHFLSHLVAAGLSGSTGAPLPLVYLYWGALTLKLQLVWCVFMAVLLLAPPVSNGFLPRLFYAWLTVLMVSGFESESFLQGAALYAAAIPLLLLLAGVKEMELRRLLPALLLAVIALFLCGSAKISAGFFVGVALLAVLWNLRQSRAMLAILAIGMALAALPLYVMALPKDLSMSGLPVSWRVMDYYQNYFNLATVLSYCVPLLAALALQLQLRVGRGAGRQWIVSWSGFPSRGGLAGNVSAWADQSDPAALVAVLSVLACVAVLVTQLIGSNVAYFSLYIFLLGLLLLPLILLRSGLHLPPKSGAALLGLLLAAMTAMGIIPFSDKTPALLSAMYRAASGQGAQYAGRVRGEIIQSLRQKHQPFATLRQHIAQSSWPRFIAELQRHDAAEGGRLAVQLAPAADDVWRRLTTGSAYWCMAPQLMIPAEAGIVELRSVAPKAIEDECAPPGTVWYGFGRAQDRHRASDFSDHQLCALAAPLHAVAVYRVLSYEDLSRNNLIGCGKN